MTITLHRANGILAVSGEHASKIGTAPLTIAVIEGSIMRFMPEGKVPADNPWPNAPVWFRRISCQEV